MDKEYNYGKLLYGTIIIIFLAFFIFSSNGEGEQSHSVKINSTIEDSKQALQKINEIRVNNGVDPIAFDERAYWLALVRCLDMEEYNYYYHTNPYTLEWCDAIKSGFDFSDDESLAENLNINVGYTYANYNEDGLLDEFTDGAIESWIDSPGHYFNLVFPNHKSGAVVVYRDTIIFYGVNTDGYGSEYLEPLDYEDEEIKNRYYKGY